jgi:hypothetical protein
VINTKPVQKTDQYFRIINDSVSTTEVRSI